MGMFRDGDIEGVFVKKMETYADNRGWLGELFRKDDPAINLIRGDSGFYPAMSYISITNPDVVRGPMNTGSRQTISVSWANSSSICGITERIHLLIKIKRYSKMQTGL